jgi:hypothetical protein
MRRPFFLVLLAWVFLWAGCGSSSDFSQPQGQSGPSSPAVAGPTPDPTPIPTPTLSPTPGPTLTPTPSPTPVTQATVNLDLSGLALPADATGLRVTGLSPVLAQTESPVLAQQYQQDFELAQELMVEALPETVTVLRLDVLFDTVAARRQEVDVDLTAGQVTEVQVGEGFVAIGEAALQGEYYLVVVVGNNPPNATTAPASTAGSALRGYLRFDGAGGLAPGNSLDVLIPHPDFVLDGGRYPASVVETEVTSGQYTVNSDNGLELTLVLEDGETYSLSGRITADAVLPEVNGSADAVDQRDYSPAALLSALVLHDGVSGAATAVQPASGVSNSSIELRLRRTFGSMVSGGTLQLNQQSFASNTVFEAGAGIIVGAGAFSPGVKPFTFSLADNGSLTLDLETAAFDLPPGPEPTARMEGVLGRNDLIVMAGPLDDFGCVIVAQSVPQLRNDTDVAELRGDYHSVRWQNIGGLSAQANLGTFTFDGAGSLLVDTLTIPYALSNGLFFLDPPIGQLLFQTPDKFYGLFSLSDLGVSYGHFQLVAPLKGE